MKTVFFGTSDFACPALRQLARHASFQVVSVVTQPDRPRGRLGRVTAPSAKLTALDLHCKVLQPESLQSAALLSQLHYMRPDFIVVAAYGKLLPREILDIPSRGSFNIHASLLPRYRGAAPIQYAIMDGCEETGVTIIRMNEGLDTGDIVLQQSTHIRDTDNFQMLHNRLAELGAELITQALTLVANGRAKFVPQNREEGSYAPKISRESELIQWDSSKRRVWNQIRALHPGPGAFCYLEVEKNVRTIKLLAADIERFVSGKPGEIVKIDKQGIHIATGRGGVVVKELQLEGRKKMTAAELVRGNPLKIGQFFFSSP